VFTTLRSTVGAGFECFASPLNTFFGRFCSAFPDVDSPFGSSGDFFGLPGGIKRGCFQANPPFVGPVMTVGLVMYYALYSFLLLPIVWLDGGESLCVIGPHSATTHNACL